MYVLPAVQRCCLDVEVALDHGSEENVWTLRGVVNWRLKKIT